MYKFHPSSIASIMPNGRGKNTLSVGAMTYLNKIAVEVLFNRKKRVYTKYMEKGTITEDLSISLLTRNSKKIIGRNTFFVKNTKRFENHHITGEPDIISGDTIIDIKSSWDIFSFPLYSESINKTYFWQLQCYMWLCDLKKSKLIYCLNDTQPGMVAKELNSLDYKMDIMEIGGGVKVEHERLVKEVIYNSIYTRKGLEALLIEFPRYELDFSDFKEIEEEKRIKVYDIPFDKNCIEQMKEKILLSWEYLYKITGVESFKTQYETIKTAA